MLKSYQSLMQDSMKIRMLNDEIGLFYERNNPDSAIYYYKIAVDLADKNLSDLDKNEKKHRNIFLKHKANSLRYIGIVHYESGTFDKAIQFVMKSLKIYEELIKSDPSKNNIIDCKNGMTFCFVPLGNIQYDQGNFDVALSYFNKALVLHKELGNTPQISGCYVNIGNVYFDQGLLEKSLEFYFKGMKIAEEIGDKKALSKCYNNIGNVLLFQGKYDEVIDYYLKAMKIKEESGDRYGVAMVNANIAEMHVLLADSVYFNSPAKRNEHLNLALTFGLKAIGIAREIKAVPLENPASNTLMRAYKRLNNYKEALIYAEVFMATKDSMFMEEKTKAVADAEKKFETEKNQLLIEKLNKEKKLNETEILAQKEHSERQRMTIVFIIAGLVLVAVFAIFIVHRLRISKKQKKIIESQKLLVDEKNVMLNQHIEEISAQRDEIEAQRDLLSTQKDMLEVQKQRITDSINYAKRIQEAVLPSGESAEKVLGEHLILFKPKDIVSGDFYWATRINEYLIITVVDCTGHGVPGAFMSMLGVSFLNEIVRKKEVRKASDVLDNLRESIIEALHQRGHYGEQKDGMDVVLCVLNCDNDVLEFAGANNPLFIVTTNNELKEIAPDKQPVAIYENMKPYTNHVIQLQKGDMVYLASDGFEDQFGGPQNKKFMVRQFKELFVQIAPKPMKEQQEILNSTFDNWKGHNDQIDDVTVLGIRV